MINNSPLKFSPFLFFTCLYLFYVAPQDSGALQALGGSVAVYGICFAGENEHFEKIICLQTFLLCCILICLLNGNFIDAAACFISLFLIHFFYFDIDDVFLAILLLFLYPYLKVI